MQSAATVLGALGVAGLAAAAPASAASPVISEIKVRFDPVWINQCKIQTAITND